MNKHVFACEERSGNVKDVQPGKILNKWIALWPENKIDWFSIEFIALMTQKATVIALKLVKMLQK